MRKQTQTNNLPEKGQLVTGRAIASITATQATEKAVGLKHHGLD